MGKSKQVIFTSMAPYFTFLFSDNGAEQLQVGGVRRSARLSVQGPLGNFSKLPSEVFSLLLNYMSGKPNFNVSLMIRTWFLQMSVLFDSQRRC